MEVAMAESSSLDSWSKTMAHFKHLSYYDQLREIERRLVKLQDSFRRFPSVPQSQPLDLISDSPANPLNFQSIEEPIEGVLESPYKESTCNSRDSTNGGSEHSSRRNGSATNPGILSQDSSIPSSSWNNISRGGNVGTSKQPEEYSRHMDELQMSIVQKSKKLEIDVSESSFQSNRIPVPLNQRISLNLGAQSTFSITNYWGSMEQDHKLLSSSESMVAKQTEEDSSLDSWKLRRQESNRKFYTDLNDMRIEFGLPPKQYHFDLLEDETKGDIVAESTNQDQVTSDSPPRSSSMDRYSIECSDFRGGPTYYQIRNGVPTNDLNTVLVPTLVEELKEPDPSSGLVELSAFEPSCYPLKFSELQSFVVEDDPTVISPCDPLILNLDQDPANVKVKLDPLVTDFASDGSAKMRDFVDLSIDHFVPMDECNSFADVIIDAAPKGMGDMIKMTVNWIEFDMDDLGTNSGAHKVFDKLSEHDVFRLESNLISHGVELLQGINASIYKNRLGIRNFVFDPGIAANWCTELYSLVLNLVASMLQL